jgi:hypothetical protein
MISDEERERRLIELLTLQVFGLVEHRVLPDGSGELYYPQPNHPDVLSFRAWRTTHERLLEQVREAVRRLAAEQGVYDTGRREWSEQTRRYEVVWEAIPPKNQQN